MSKYDGLFFLTLPLYFNEKKKIYDEKLIQHLKNNSSLQKLKIYSK